ncbi:NAD(P)/FAD-dependent oxidoreductase [Nonomuraea ceibae]|uniref:NAD(P)/FAD-dependent oxidoreductase n=1 Tax=Nonomuraea ceibae TaxID=1935170 RepID=UPI001C5EB6E1|nr:NAD(P)/FAD-dependent oxidoreductase [Nonomuraea ceibae]
MGAARPTAIIVGAGIAGLACALRLHQAGVHVRVLESADGVGGRMRTDLVDGYRLDRGFQVFNTGYPEAGRVLDIKALRLRSFSSGMLIFGAGGLHRVMLPWKHPRHALSGPLSGVGSLKDWAALGAMTFRDMAAPAALLRGGRERSTRSELRHWGISEAMIDQLLRPFLSGVLLERKLETSSTFFHLVWRSFARGTIGLPALGMGQIPIQLATRLPSGALHLGRPVEAITDDGVLLRDGHEMAAAAVIVATDPRSAADLLPEVRAPAMRSVTTFYHAAPRSPLGEATQIIDAEGHLADTLVLTDAAPEYAADGRALISTSVLGVVGDDHEPQLRARLEEIYGDTRGWRHLATYAIRDALPAMLPPLSLRRPVRLASGRYVCGDHRDTSSIQGALVSGRRAAQAALTDLCP